MAKMTVTIKKRKVGEGTGYMTCNVCHGTGRQKIPNRKSNARPKGRTPSR